MLRARAVLAKSGWSGEAVDSLVLDFNARRVQRCVLKGVRGLEVALDLPEAIVLRGGDALQLEDGRLVEIVGAPEALVEIRPADAGQAARLAWRLGERRLPLQIVGAKLRIRRDAEAEAIAASLGARIVEIEAPFEPNAADDAPAHDHGHRHDHAHHHAHGACCGHDHPHEHHVHAAGGDHAHAPHDHDGCCGHHHRKA